MALSSTFFVPVVKADWAITNCGIPDMNEVDGLM